MEILTAIFVLFCAGVIVAYSSISVRSHEAPKQETTIQVVMQQNQNSGKNAATLPEGAKEGNEKLLVEQKPQDRKQ
jgi:hypothetical protein